MRRILFPFFLLLSVAVSAQDIEGFINRQLQTYPKSRLIDIYKSCFQDYMGAEHLVSDRQRVKAYLDEELNTTSLDDLMLCYILSLLVCPFSHSGRWSHEIPDIG